MVAKLITKVSLSAGSDLASPHLPARSRREPEILTLAFASRPPWWLTPLCWLTHSDIWCSQPHVLAPCFQGLSADNTRQKEKPCGTIEVAFSIVTMRSQ